MVGEYPPEIVQALKKSRKCGLVTGLLLLARLGMNITTPSGVVCPNKQLLNAPISNQWDV